MHTPCASKGAQNIETSAAQLVENKTISMKEDWLVHMSQVHLLASSFVSQGKSSKDPSLPTGDAPLSLALSHTYQLVHPSFHCTVKTSCHGNTVSYQVCQVGHSPWLLLLTKQLQGLHTQCSKQNTLLMMSTCPAVSCGWVHIAAL